MAGYGGKREGAGAKKNQHRIAAGDLRRDLEAKLGISYTEMLAQTQLKLFNDFKSDINIKEYLVFTENMCKRLLIQEKDVLSEEDEFANKSKEELQGYRDLLLTRLALSTPLPKQDAEE